MGKTVDKQAKFLLMVCNLVEFATELGYQVTGGELLRTPEQAAIYASQGKGIKNSLHISKLAIDLNFFRQGKLITGRVNLECMGLHWKALGGRWGGDFKWIDDSSHFELA